jgi:uncharacterized membrane protein
VLPAVVGAVVGGKPTALLKLVLMLLQLLRRIGGAMVVHRPVLRGALPDGAATVFLFFVSLWVRIASSAMMTFLTNFGNDPLVLSAMRSYNFVE